MSERAASISETGVLAYCNQHLAQMIGKPHAELMGTDVSQLIAAPERAAFAQLMENTSETVMRAEMHFHAQTGR